MPIVTQDTVTGYAHCTDPRCAGSVQEPDVELVKTTTSLLYTDLGGDLPHEERSTVMYTFADSEDAVCSRCSGPRECSVQKRPEYQRVVGNQDMLLELRTGAQDRNQTEINDLRAQVAALTASSASGGSQGGELEQMRAELAELKEALAGKANKPGPKPKGEG